MDTKKIFIYGLLAAICFSLWGAWQKDYGNKPNQSQTATVQTKTTNDNNQTVPTLVNPNIIKVAKIPAARLVHVKTDVLDLTIDTLGGNIISAKLPKYPLDTKTPNIPVRILHTNPNKLYIAESGLIGAKDNNKPIQYKITQKQYTISPGQKSLVVNLKGYTAQGLVVTKSFTLTPGSYAVKLDYKINNQSNKSWSGQFYTQIKRKKPKQAGGLFRLHTYTGAAISSPKKPYKKISYSKMKKENLSQNIKGGWVAMQQRYFLSTWIPDQNKLHHYYSHVNDDIYTIGMTNRVNIGAGGQSKFSANFYVGPEVSENLAPLAKGLNLTIDYGWLWVLSVAVFWLMQHIFNFVGNWGWSIVIVTVLIKLVFYKFSEASYMSMAKMRALAPKMKLLKERCGGDKQKMGQATMELYKKEKINPISGCLPQLIQIPFFIAFYYVLIEAVQLRQAPFIFWLHDLSLRDPYYVLPILMGITMFFTQKMTPMSPDPAQQKMMMFMPLIFVVLFASFPAGLTLYWLINYLCSGLQQWYIMRKYERSHKKR